MKRNNTLKSLFLAASFLSLFAFAFVNLRANTSITHAFSGIEMGQGQVDSEEVTDADKLPVPDVSVLSRVWEIAQRLLDRTN